MAPIFLSLSAEQPSDADPTLSEGAAQCQAEPGAPTPEDDQGGQGFGCKSVLSSLTALLLLPWRDFQCGVFSSLTHSSSSHSQTFSIRAHSSLPGCWFLLVAFLVGFVVDYFFFFFFFKRLEISSGGLRCHPNGSRSASRKVQLRTKPNVFEDPHSSNETPAKLPRAQT